MRDDADLQALKNALRQFAAERDVEPFHTPKNLAMALTVEAAELLQHFQWLREGTADELGPEKVAAVRGELADVLLYLVMLADRLGVDLEAAAWETLAKNAEKYPVVKARDSAKKYTEL